MRAWLTRLLLVALLLAGAAGDALARRIALVVGADDYLHVPKLANAVNDATDLTAKLRAIDFDVELVTNPDWAALAAAVQRFGERARGAEAALFFYAGHAIEVQGRNWIIPVSAELRSPQQLPFQAVDLDAITAQTQQAAQVSIIMLDACRDNPFRQRWPSAFRDISGGRGLARVSAPTGTLVVFSAAPGEVAEDGRGRNSPFTEALLQHIDTPGLEVRAMVDQVRGSVLRATGNRQVVEDQSRMTGSFFFRAALPVPTPTPAPTPPPTPPPVVQMPGLSADLVVWPTIAQSRNPADFERFIEQFPSSPLIPFARNRLTELRREAALAVPTPPPPPPPDPNRALTPVELREAQGLLAGWGFATGAIGETPGPRVEEALRAFAIATGLPESSGFTLGILERLRRDPPSRLQRALALATLADRALRAADLEGADRLAAASLAIETTLGAAATRSEVERRRAAASQASLPVITPPVVEPARPLSAAEIQEAQRLLSGMGFNTGGADGVVGPRSREAMRAFAIAADLPETLDYTSQALSRLRQGPPAAERRAAALVTLGQRALQAGDAGGAQRMAQAALQIRADGAAHLLAGDAAQRLGDINAARAAFEAAGRAGAGGAAARLAALPAVQLPAPLSQRSGPGRQGWAIDPRSGCAVWNPSEEDRAVTWSGGCEGGLGSGSGTQVWRWANGAEDRFTGTLRAGFRQGPGTYVWASGDRYEGDWRDGNRTGRGNMRWANGDRYDGEWREGLRTGRGSMTWANGNRYEGDWRDGAMTGRGSMAWTNGDRYEGDWRADQRTGRGVYVWADGNRYEGEVDRGNRNGRGTMIWAGGGRYDGLWRNDRPHGFGVAVTPAGVRNEGEFNAGCLWEGTTLRSWAVATEADCRAQRR